MSTLEHDISDENTKLLNRELVFVAALMMAGVVFAMLILSGIIS